MSDHTDITRAGVMPADIEWLRDGDDHVALGYRSVERDGEPWLELYLPDGTHAASVGSEDAADLIAMLQTGITFSEIVGDHRFRIDLNGL